jgi:alanine or glycine:cation symporter, AGCS family
MLGSILSLPTVSSFADVANGFIAVPNLILVIVRNGVIVAETRCYLWSGNLDEGAPGTGELVSAGS